jgi:hypothetical protein
VVETGRVLPIASAVPLAIGAMLLWRSRRGRRTRLERKGCGPMKLLAKLVENAISHSPPGAHIHVVLGDAGNRQGP